ncbi:MAG TPA: hypothetical protein VJN43_23910 [Bryobacteraceae bacterium]|nr:hypothetical protein [Bryobacteraceae bacterium]
MPKKRTVRPLSKNWRNAARGNIKRYLEGIPASDLVRLSYDLGNFTNWWIGEPSEQRIEELRNSIPRLNDIVDFNVVRRRLAQIHPSTHSSFGVPVSAFFPELIEINKHAIGLIHKLPNSVEKAELFLRPIAEDCGADADVEAAVYLASRGKLPAIGADEVRARWYAAICEDIPHHGVGKSASRDAVARAKAGTISLAEAAEILLNGLNDRFFSFRDEEEDFIDAALFRAVEWLDITGFEPWLRGLIEPLSVGPKYGVGEGAGWWLFFLSRSDLALQMAGQQGPEAWLWALLNGDVKRDSPWRVFWGGEQGRVRDYLPLAGIIPFVWTRINPKALKQDPIERANELLFQTQLKSGAWPLFKDSSEPCLISTCFAVHGLALSQPSGWQRPASRAAEWIQSQQGHDGLWHVQGGPAVMLTVLALDSLELARGGTRVTFGLHDDQGHRAPKLPTSGMVTPARGAIGDYSKANWFDPKLPPLKSLPRQRARKDVKVSLLIIVATETELRQVLRVLSPIRKQQKIWKVADGHDTFYLGRFGAFTAAVVLSGMGSQGVTGATLTVGSAIDSWRPIAVLLVGIAFGSSRAKQAPADVLVGDYLIPYEQQRVGEKLHFRNPVPPSSEILLNRFRNALQWSFERPDGSKCRLHVGPLLSGEKLIDDIQFKSALLEQFPNAVGGEMEGTGLWSAAARARKEWIVVKGVCDWADGQKNDNYQCMAAAAAVSLCHHVFSDGHALDGI